MKPKVFIDTNVLMDVILGNRPSSEASSKVFQRVREGKLEGVIATQSIVDASYAIRKHGEDALAQFRRTVLELFTFFNDDSVSYFDIKYACLNSSGDFEDDAMFSRAKYTVCDAIVTNDIKFRKKHEGEDRHIRFFTPEELVAQITA